MNQNNLCPCGSGKSYEQCCEVFISNKQNPSTPEELMRSRYTAYCKANIGYIQQTMKPPASNHFDVAEAEVWAKKVNFTRLEVIKSSYRSTVGEVEFRAHYVVDHKKKILHEISQFSLIGDKWYYVDGDQPNKSLPQRNLQKIKPNNKCPCGSDKKYKKCCG